jgi:hypothetical protein
MPIAVLFCLVIWHSHNWLIYTLCFYLNIFIKKLRVDKNVIVRRAEFIKCLDERRVRKKRLLLSICQILFRVLDWN